MSDQAKTTPIEVSHIKPSLLVVAAYCGMMIYLIGPQIIVDTLSKISGNLTSNEVRAEAERYQSARGNEEALQSYIENCISCKFRSEAEKEVSSMVQARAERNRVAERSEIRSREKIQYDFARRDIDRLSIYARDCKICEFKASANAEIASIRSDEESSKNRERSSYGRARGDLEALKQYLRECRICEYRQLVSAEIEELEKPRPTMTWIVERDFDEPVGIGFYSSNGRRAWPDWNAAHLMRERKTFRYNLNCELGERVCYGAWIAGGSLGKHWGQGYRAAYSCDDCCRLCNGGQYLIRLSVDSTR